MRKEAGYRAFAKTLAGIFVFLLLGISLFFNAKAETSGSSSRTPEASSPLETEGKKTKTGYRVILEDDAELLSAQEKTQLLLEMEEITAYGNAAFKSISHNAWSASYYADEYYHELFHQESGILFLIDMDNREIYIFCDGELHRTVTNAYANTITDNIYQYASDGDYYRCASAAFHQAGSLLAGQKIAQPMKYISNALMALVLAALLNYFLVRLTCESPKPSSGNVLGAISTKYAFANPHMNLTRQTKVYSPSSSSSGGGHRGGGGGRHSGGGGGHRF